MVVGEFEYYFFKAFKFLTVHLYYLNVSQSRGCQGRARVETVWLRTRETLGLLAPVIRDSVEVADTRALTSCGREVTEITTIYPQTMSCDLVNSFS